MQLLLHVIPLRLRHTFTISHGSHDVQHNLIVELRDGDHRGFGEASTVGFYGNSGHTMAASLEKVRAAIEAETVDEPARFWARVAPLLRDDPFALCALDQAAHDLWGRRLGRPVWQLWGLDLGRLPPSDYTIGIAPVDVMVLKLQEFPHFPVYKIKLGTPDDLAIVRALRAVTSAKFRVDANCAWDAATAIRLSAPLRDLGVEFLEQPLPAADVAGHREVFAHSVLPVIADESCQSEADVDRCAGLFHGVNIKLTKCGGLTPARRMIARARELGLSVMIGCMTESTVGISAIGQLVPLLDYADMDGALLLLDDVADGVRVQPDGRIHYPDAPGLGLTWLGPTAARPGA
jgi:L-alanine-DL-glutamate epimerase-like enolase superfamily enzyme